MTLYKIAQANTHKFYKGDPVTPLSTGYIDVVASGTVQILGIFIGCKYFSTSQQKVVWSPTFQGADASADIDAYVIDDPNVIFQVQVGASGPVAGGPATQADVFANFGYGGQSAGNATTGLSAAYLDYGTRGPATSTLPFKLIPNLVTDPPGINGSDITTAGNIVNVIMNNQTMKSSTGI